MSSLNPPLNKDDFLHSSWQEVINSCSQKECLEYSIVFWNKSKEVENVREKTVFETLAVVTNPIIVREQTETNFQNLFQNIREESLIFLADIVSDISDAELQARVADILWVKRYHNKDSYKMAQLAIDAYLKSAQELEKTEHWSECLTRIERALRLASQIKDGSRKNNVINYIEEFFERYQGKEPISLSLRLMELLQQFKIGDPQKYINLCQKILQKEMNWEQTRLCYDTQAKWYLMNKDQDNVIKSLMLSAETYVNQANHQQKQSSFSYIGLSELIRSAIKTFKRIQGTKEQIYNIQKRIDELQKLLIEYQKKSISEFKVISSELPLDAVAETEKARKLVEGKDLRESLIFLSSLSFPNLSVSSLRKITLENAQKSIFQTITPRTCIDLNGRTVSRNSVSILSDDPNEREEAIYLEMYQQAIDFQSYYVYLYIEPIRQQINLEHGITLNEIFLIVYHSPFIPINREYLFVKGLYAGLTGDFMTATHLLIPQIENSIRELLKQKDQNTVKDDNEGRGIHKEDNLNNFLDPQKYPAIQEIFDENTLFHLRGLLIKEEGGNLRNRMAHGLIDDHEFNGAIMCYLWWLTLRLCLLPMLNNQETIKQDDTIEQFAGIFANDPLFDDFIEDMAAYRKEIDNQVANTDNNTEEK